MASIGKLKAAAGASDSDEMSDSDQLKAMKVTLDAMARINEISDRRQNAAAAEDDKPEPDAAASSDDVPEDDSADDPRETLSKDLDDVIGATLGFAKVAMKSKGIDDGDLIIIGTGDTKLGRNTTLKQIGIGHTLDSEDLPATLRMLVSAVEKYTDDD